MKMKVTPDTITTWIPDNWRFCTIPIFRNKDLHFDSLFGTCFLLDYGGKSYFVTNQHILENEKPFFGIRQFDEKFMPLPNDRLEAIGLSWINHPSLDLAAIPIPINTRILKNPLHCSIDEQYWNIDPELTNGDVVSPLGYPKSLFSNFADGTDGILPIAMPGEILSFDDIWIKCSCCIQKGASGGPLFLKNSKGTAYLAGVVKSYDKDDNSTFGKCLRIKHVKRILDLEDMKNQITTLNKNLSIKNE